MAAETPRHLAFLLTHPVWDVTAIQQGQIADMQFLLTHPVWDVTGGAVTDTAKNIDFYSHIPCGM